jgi:predicted TIM-barrel fold metal-dependent hydrolase
MIIDFHVHVGDRSFWLPRVDDFQMQYFESSGYAATLDAEGRMSVDGFCRVLEASGVDYAVCLADNAPGVTGLASNAYVAAFCAGRPSLIPFCSLNPYLDADMPGQLRRLVAERGFCGIKLTPTYSFFRPDQHQLYAYLAVAEELQVPVLAHTGSSIFPGARIDYGDPLIHDDVLRDFPNLTIVMAHGGRGFWYEAAAWLVERHANLYIDVAGLPPQNLPRFFPKLEAIAPKLVFGTDWPAIPSYANNIAAIRSLPLPAETKEGILGGNAARILRRALAARGRALAV